MFGFEGVVKMLPAKILVVDDELELERLMKQRFRRKIRTKELEFVFASNGLEALKKLEDDVHIDMILTDLNMPQMDGLTLIDLLAGLNESLKVVVISAYSDMSNIRQAMNRGAFDFLTKPIDFHDLEQTIEKTLNFVRHTENKRKQERKIQDELLQAAFYDSLTGLPNRAWIWRHLNQIFEQRRFLGKEQYALLFIDLDEFKAINDMFGHLTGDAFLQCVAQRMKLALREEDCIARLGGDEFIVLLESIKDLADATGVAERIQAQLKRPFKLGVIEMSCGASIGIALSDYRHKRPEELLQDADTAMYVAKEQGKGRYEVFGSNTGQDRVGHHLVKEIYGSSVVDNSLYH